MIPRARLQLRLSRNPARPQARRDVPLSAASRTRAPAPLRAEGEGRTLDRKLAHLLAELDRLLEHPLDIDRTAAGRTVWVFRHVGYRVSLSERRVCAVVRPAGRVEATDWGVELMRPLSTPFFLVPLLRALGLSDAGRQAHLFLAPADTGGQEEWLAAAGYAALARDARFRELRRRALPKALDLDRTLVSIALLSRSDSARRGLRSSDFNAVWRAASRRGGAKKLYFS